MHSPFSLSLQIRFFISNFLTLRSHLWSSNSLNFFQMYSVYWLCLSMGNLHSHCWLQASFWVKKYTVQAASVTAQLFLHKEECKHLCACLHSMSKPYFFSRRAQGLNTSDTAPQPTFQFATRVVWRTVMDFPQQILPKALSWELQPDVQTLDTDTPRFSSSTWKAGFMQIFLNNIEL